MRWNLILVEKGLLVLCFGEFMVDIVEFSMIGMDEVIEKLN